MSLPPATYIVSEIISQDAGSRYTGSGCVYYDYVLPRYADYLSSLCFHCHPLLIERGIVDGHVTDRYRLSAADVEYVQLIFDDQPILTRFNTNREEVVCHPHEIDAIWCAPIEFFRDAPLVTQALRGTIKLRIGFWREPVSPFWLSYTLGYVANKYYIPHRIMVDSYNGRQMLYCWGSLMVPSTL